MHKSARLSAYSTPCLRLYLCVLAQIALLTGLLCFFYISALYADTESYGNLICHYVRNYDGDTITVDIPEVHPLLGDRISVRVNGIDTPEIRKTRGALKAKARTAKRLTENLCKRAKVIELRNVQRGKYFRIVADVYVDGKNLAEILIKNGLAKPYDGGKKPVWTE